MGEDIRIAICEDSEKDRALLLERIRASGIAAKCEAFASGEAFMASFKPGMYHLVYLDIYMAEMTGIDVAAAIRKLDEDVPLAFTTTSRNYAFEANQYDSLLYIEKPVTQKKINHTLTLAAALRDKLEAETLTVSTDGGRLDIRYNDLYYIEVMNQRCILQMRGGRKVVSTTKASINDLEKMLPKPRFIRTHRAYIVNMDKIQRFNGTDFVMKGGGIAYITQKERRRIKAAYDSWLISNVQEDEI